MRPINNYPLVQPRNNTSSGFIWIYFNPCLIPDCSPHQVKDAVTYVEQGHIRVGPHLVTDPAFLVTRNMQDFITWADGSKIKRQVMAYNDVLDDFDLMNC